MYRLANNWPAGGPEVGCLSLPSSYWRAKEVIETIGDRGVSTVGDLREAFDGFCVPIRPALSTGR